jgi:hypothetical protein
MSKLKIKLIHIKKIENDTEQLKTVNMLRNSLHDNLMTIIQEFEPNVVTYDVTEIESVYDRNRLTISFETDIDNLDKNKPESSNFDEILNMKLRQFFRKNQKTASIYVEIRVI